MTTNYRCALCHKLFKGPDIPPPEPNFCPSCDTGKLHPVKLVTTAMLREAETA